MFASSDLHGQHVFFTQQKSALHREKVKRGFTKFHVCLLLSLINKTEEYTRSCTYQQRKPDDNLKYIAQPCKILQHRGEEK